MALRQKAIRVDDELWEKFKKLTKYQDSDASKEIRKFIKRYLAEHSQLFLEMEAKRKSS